MLETKFKVLFLLAVLAFAAIPIMGILRGTSLTPFEISSVDSTDSAPSVPLNPDGVSREEPVPEEMVSIPAGPFIRGTDHGGFDERPQRTLVLSAFAIDRNEVTNFQ
ncbi:MAG TPA: SUMF1/EgtB/PvdO family nonheme iron enzyme, partial [Nitrospiraceae bacterium]|nr:SUMF1/EgtB/PvdO family nonheme iron enzyme [Nitrospiraceae bacterium]